MLRERETQKGLLVAACDGDVLGRTFEEGDISLTVNEEFYGGDTVDSDTLVDSLRRATVANLVGVEVVGVAIEHGLIDEAQVLEIDGTRHAQLLYLNRW